MILWQWIVRIGRIAKHYWKTITTRRKWAVLILSTFSHEVECFILLSDCRSAGTNCEGGAHLCTTVREWILNLILRLSLLFPSTFFARAGMDWNLLFILLSISTIIVAPRKASSQCSSPSEQEVKQGLTTTVERLLSEETLLENIILHNFNIVCYAVKGLDSYSSVSVVASFTKTTTGGTTSSNIYQFQMECIANFGWVENGEGSRTVSDSYLTLEPRHDCISCSYLQSDDGVWLCVGKSFLSHC